MNVKEIIIRRKFIISKINEVDKVLLLLKDKNLDNKGTLYTKLINYKFDLLNKIRNYNLILAKLNTETSATLEEVTLTINELLQLLKTAEDKINTLSTVISDGSCDVLDVFSLMDKKDQLVEEYINIYKALQTSDIETVWEN